MNSSSSSVSAPIVIAARVLLALMFVLAGFSKFAGLEGTAGYIASKGLPLPGVLAFATAALEVVGGLALAFGLQARWAAGALALFTLVASFLFHNFWAMPADQAVAEIRRHAGRQFDPAVVEAFLRCQPEMEKARTTASRSGRRRHTIRSACSRGRWALRSRWRGP